MKIGVISDTHGLLRPEALAQLAGSEVILHAGDVGKGNILAQLGELAPVHAIRGNIDRDEWAANLPHRLKIELGGLTFLMLHDLKQLDLDPKEEGINVVVSGHSHKPRVHREGEIMYLNPGAAGHRRFSLPITLARLDLQNGVAEVEIIDLFA